MIGDAHSLTTGYVVRHVPPASRVGREIAVLDIAQDFLLAHLAEEGVFDSLVVFKGGTALRKLYAGSQGRFSTDIDLAALDPDADRADLRSLIADQCRVTLGPFTFRPEARGDRWLVSVASEFGDPGVSIKLDVGPPCWLAPEPRPFVTAPIHRRYGFDLPDLPCMRLEEILAEKVARLARMSTARDASDLVWAAQTSPFSGFDKELVRRLAMLKVWADNHGIRPGWASALSPATFDPARWFADRGDDWDDEQIGLLAHPPPRLRDLQNNVHRHYAWLRDLQVDESRWARADARDRGEVIRAIQALPAGALGGASLH
jgi:uncharacterized protein